MTEKNAGRGGRYGLYGCRRLEGNCQRGTPERTGIGDLENSGCGGGLSTRCCQLGGAHIGSCQVGRAVARDRAGGEGRSAKRDRIFTGGDRIGCERSECEKELTSYRQMPKLRGSRSSQSGVTPAQVAELVDALASGASGGNSVEVRVLSWAPIVNEGRLNGGLRLFRTS